MTRVTLDTNEQISAFNFRGQALELIHHTINGEIEMAISEPILQETIARPTGEVRVGDHSTLIVGSNAFVAQNVVGQRETVAAGAPAEYRRLTNGAERLSVDFRFRTGRADLDNKAIVDLDRVISFVSDLHYSGDSVLLFGFADSTGGRQMNQALSENRANTVAREFEQRGLHPGTVRGFGPDLPVASNDTDEGREKNRRVEIWVRK